MNRMGWFSGFQPPIQIPEILPPIQVTSKKVFRPIEWAADGFVKVREAMGIERQ
jgi:hypothetical protein